MIRLNVSALLSVALLMSAANVSARGVRIDFEDVNYDFSGQAWETLQFVDVNSDLNTTAIDIGFSINFGTGLVDTLFINENGFVSFGTAVDFVGGISALSELGGDVVAPFYANLQSANGASGTTFVDESVSYSRGRLDREAPFEDQASAPLAMRITWNNLLDSDGNSVQFQALFVQTAGAAGNFDLELNYGSLAASQIPSAAGFFLNGVSYNVAGALNSSVDYTLSFVDGGYQSGGVNPPPTPVSEPGSLLLFLTGLGMLALASGLGRSFLEA